MENGENGDVKAVENNESGHENWRQHTGTKILFVVAAGALAGLTALLWPTIQKALGPDTDTPSRFWAAAFVAIAFIIIGILAYFVAEKTLWELLEFLVVPLAIPVIGLWFTIQQDARLQAYVEYMGTLILDDGFAPQSESTENAKILVAMKAGTLEVLKVLDSEHKGRVVVFLYGAELLSTPPNPSDLELDDVDLSGAALDDTALRDIYLRYADLSNADLSNVVWGAAILEDADLRGADLSGAYLSEAYLNGSKIGCTRVRCADLSGADLSGAHLNNANLSGADLSDANLSGADLEGADVTDEQLAECKSLKGATMSDGQKYDH